MLIKSCGILITRGQPIDSFLLMRHAHRWDLPKGHVDDGETELQCAYRELWEETGLRAAQIELFPDFRFTQEYLVREKRLGGKEVPKTLVIFLARLLADAPIVATEHLGHQWFPWNPPHNIQQQTIDPLLAAVETFVAKT